MIHFHKPFKYLELFFARVYGVLMLLSFYCREFVIVSRYNLSANLIYTFLVKALRSLTVQNMH